MTARTFGDLLKDGVFHWSATCSFCKHYQGEPGYLGATKYSTRHFICRLCIAQRKDVVLPAIRKQERLERRLSAIRSRNAG